MTNAKRIAVAVGVVVALNVLVALLASGLRTPSGPPSSTYATSAPGLAAYASLLEEFGYTVERYRRPLGDEPLDATATLVLLDPAGVPRDGTRALRDFLDDGGRLVAGGRAPGWLDEVVDDAPTWSPSGDTSFTSGTADVRAEGDGSWSQHSGARVVAGDPGAALVVEASQGEGTALLVADVSPLQNRLLDEGENAALGLTLAGSAERRVVFVESVHGYGLGSGLAALPERARWTFAGLALAAVVWLWARGMRIGPAEQAARPLPPPRRAYVEALAATLARTDRARRGNP